MKILKQFYSEHGLVTLTVESKTVEGHSWMTSEQAALEEQVADLHAAVAKEIAFDERTRHHLKTKA